jgi:two-component system LytT family response regulator
MRVLIVDDEAPARKRLRQLLDALQGVEIVGECENGFQALDALPKYEPDLIFLDIQMPGMDGFSLLRAIPKEDCPLIVFVTAFNQHAVEAFEVHAIDYILKPFRLDRLKKSVDRAQGLLSLESGKAASQPKIEELLQATPPEKGAEYPERFAVKDGPRWFIIPIGDIVTLEASGNYVEVHTADKRCLLWRETMARLEVKLNPKRFFRASRSAFVNLTAIREIRSEGKSGHTIFMSNGSTVHLTMSLDALQAKLV